MKNIRNFNKTPPEIVIDLITTKVWVTNYGHQKAAASIDESLRKLRTDYIDLLLLHQPYGNYYGAYQAMEEAYKAGKLRAIGISNFYLLKIS